MQVQMRSIVEMRSALAPDVARLAENLAEEEGVGEGKQELPIANPY